MAINITCDSTSEHLWIQNIIEIGKINKNKGYHGSILDSHGLTNKSFDVTIRGSENFVEDLPNVRLR